MELFLLINLTPLPPTSEIVARLYMDMTAYTGGELMYELNNLHRLITVPQKSAVLTAHGNFGGPRSRHTDTHSLRSVSISI